MIALLGVFAWLPEPAVLPERGVEIELRTTEHENLGDTHIRDTVVWTGVQVGITDRLELTLPAEFAYSSAVGMEPALGFRGFAAELRYRFVDRDARLAPLARFAIVRDVVRRDVVHAELDATLAFTHGRVVVAGELGITGDVNRVGGLRMLLRPSAGASVRIVDELRAGAEVHAELPRESGATRWIVAGPTLAWRHGRFWLAAHYGFGVSNVDRVPRFVWSVAF